VQSLVPLTVHADLWKKCDNRRRHARQQIHTLESVLRDRAAIQAQAERLTFLDRHLGGLGQRVEAAGRRQTAESRLASLRTQAANYAEQRRRLEEAAAEQVAASPPKRPCGACPR
jgi:hypothetical protein